MLTRRPNMLKSAKELIPGGLAHGRKDSEFDPEALRVGIDVEMEHTGSRGVAKEIAKDHLMEHPDYYKHLKKMEEKLEGKNKP